MNPSDSKKARKGIFTIPKTTLSFIFTFPIYGASGNVDGAINGQKCCNTVNIVSMLLEVTSRNNERMKLLILRSSI